MQINKIGINFAEIYGTTGSPYFAKFEVIYGVWVCSVM
jgi:hypothetical protein